MTSYNSTKRRNPTVKITNLQFAQKFPLSTNLFKYIKNGISDILEYSFGS